MSWYIAKKYKHRQQILEVLKNQYYSNISPDSTVVDYSYEYQELNNLTHLNDIDLRSNLTYLQNENEVDTFEYGNRYCYFATQSGVSAADDEKYLNEGKNKIIDKVKFLGVVVSIVISVTTFFISMYKSNDNKDEIELLKKEIIELKSKK